MSTLYEAAQVLVQTHARRLPLLDYDSETGHEVIVSTLTQYRLLKFISINVSLSFRHHRMHLTLIQCHREIQQLNLPLRKLRIGTYVAASSPEDVPEGQNPYHPIATATLNTTVFNVVHMFSEQSISAVPIINENGIVVNLYETVDVIVSTICTYTNNFNHSSHTLRRLWFARENTKISISRYRRL